MSKVVIHDRVGFLTPGQDVKELRKAGLLATAQYTYLDRGAKLPDDLEDDAIKHLESNGAIADEDSHEGKLALAGVDRGDRRASAVRESGLLASEVEAVKATQSAFAQPGGTSPNDSVGDLMSLTSDVLVTVAKALGIAGTDDMDKRELAEAITEKDDASKVDAQREARDQIQLDANEHSSKAVATVGVGDGGSDTHDSEVPGGDARDQRKSSSRRGKSERGGSGGGRGEASRGDKPPEQQQ